jgi:hypothetical protein
MRWKRMSKKTNRVEFSTVIEAGIGLGVGI